MTTTAPYKKRLEGVKFTDELHSLVLKAADQSAAPGEEVEQAEKNTVVSEATAALNAVEAKSALDEFSAQNDPKKMIPIAVVRAMHSVFLSDKNLMAKLEDALTKTSLVFTPPPSPSAQTAEQRKFKRRMERLKLKAEESRYQNLTSNLPRPIADDVTTRSMTYAASVGLNMIIAPISFGVFMYFFAGQIFSWVGGNDSDSEKDSNKTDIGRVIAGVVCGVGMLFIEMILFVIRTHEFDASMRKKSKKSPSPFGYTKPKVKPS